MSQFMLCKSQIDLTSYDCTKVEHCFANNEYLLKIAGEIFEDVNLGEIWAVTDIDNLFTQAQKQLFESSKLPTLLSSLFDVCDILVLWYSDFYNDLDEVNTKEQFLISVKNGIHDPSGMCECYLYVKCLHTAL